MQNIVAGIDLELSLYAVVQMHATVHNHGRLSVLDAFLSHDGSAAWTRTGRTMMAATIVTDKALIIELLHSLFIHSFLALFV